MIQLHMLIKFVDIAEFRCSKQVCVTFGFTLSDILLYILHVHFTDAGNADDSRKGEKEEAASYENEENPFSLLFQPPSTFSPRSLEDKAHLASGPSPVDSSPSIGSSGHSPGSSGFANCRKKFQSQPVHEQSLTLSLSGEQPVSNQATQFDVSGMT